MQVDIEWSKTEKAIAKLAFDKAYEREINALLGEVREKVSGTFTLQDMWNLHDYLSAKRHDIDGKYDYRYSVLIFVFAQLVREGWLSLNDLDGLDEKKLTRVIALVNM
ncbi:hypothetical protein [Pseudanabaena sp. PCC 6802]|uniref:hypothetical protein n=1 Tax=Pseudanabaena sp. PCC 6802 TaxID=118173 RepID=UPI000347706D|nr:hypothetical protein [Pseudanabaena sp. PCC 6802]